MTQRQEGGTVEEASGEERSHPRRGRGGRPSKGDRYAFMARVPTELADLVIAAADEAGMTRSDYIAQVLASHVTSTGSNTETGV